MTTLLQPAPILLTGGIVGLAGCLLLMRGGVGREGDAESAGIRLTWLLAAFVNAMAAFGNAFRGELPPMLVLTCVNAVQILALSLLWLGARRIAGRATPGWMAVLPPGIWLAASLVPGFLTSLPARMLLFTPLACGLLGWAVIDLVSAHRRRPLRALIDLAFMVSLIAVSLVWLLMSAAVSPPPQPPVWGPISGPAPFVIALFVATLPLLILGIWREQEQLDQRTASVQALEAGRMEVQRLHDGLPAVIYLHRPA